MLAVHWTPVNRTKLILKNGIRKSKKGLFCFPLTGHKTLDRWWIYFFNQCGARNKKNYNGIVFRIKDEDLPAYFGHWIGATNKCEFKKEIKSIKELGQEFRKVILWRLGEEIARSKNLDYGIYDWQVLDRLYLKLAEEELQNNPNNLKDKFNSLSFMTYVFEDYQIVLSKSIPAKRIIKILPHRNDFGKIIRKQKLNKYDR